MSRVVRILFALAITALVLPGSARAQQTELSIYATVLNEAGAPVTALTAADFVVREGGVQREILRVSPATDPMQIAVLVDTSQAVNRHLTDLRGALRGFFREMQGKHEIALIGFGERPTVLVDYTRDPARLEAGVGRIFAHQGSGAYVLEAIAEASRALRKREGARSAIVVITAEGREFSNLYHRTVLDELRGTNATLHAFVLSRPRAIFIDEAAREREITLADGSKSTGGRREHLLTSMALEERLGDLVRELNNQYHIVYVRPGALIAPDTIDVDVRHDGLTVRAPRTPRTTPRTTGSSARPH
jgi:Ca-activated chloride channel homolog